MYQYVVDHIPKSPSKRPGTKANMTSITVHNTANEKSTARNERNWLTNPYNKATASWHIAVDDKEVIEAIPLDELAWHAGDGAKGPGNTTSIGVELCESGDQAKVWQNAVILIAKMLNEREWEVDRVHTHKKWSGKNCPRLILPRWEEFLDAINTEQAKITVKKINDNLTKDVSPWAVEAHKWVMEQGISDGTSPKGPVTREQLWTMLYNYERRKNQ